MGRHRPDGDRWFDGIDNHSLCGRCRLSLIEDRQSKLWIPFRPRRF